MMLQQDTNIKLFNELSHKRTPIVLHRSAIVIEDKLTDFVASDITIADGGVGTGSLAASTVYYVTACPGNAYGNTKVSITPIDTLTTAAYGAATGSIRATIAQKVGATCYDVFCSVDTAPKWVARITEAQRASGGFKVDAYGVVSESAGVPAGCFDICVVGTGLATSAAPFTINTAYVFSGSIVPISMVGKKACTIFANISVTDLRSNPSFTIVPFMKNTLTGEYYVQNSNAFAPLTQYSPFKKAYSLVPETAAGFYSGTSELVILVDTITGQGISADIYVETY